MQHGNAHPAFVAVDLAVAYRRIRLKADVPSVPIETKGMLFKGKVEHKYVAGLGRNDRPVTMTAITLSQGAPAILTEEPSCR